MLRGEEEYVVFVRGDEERAYREVEGLAGALERDLAGAREISGDLVQHLVRDHEQRPDGVPFGHGGSNEYDGGQVRVVVMVISTDGFGDDLHSPATTKMTSMLSVAACMGLCTTVRVLRFPGPVKAAMRKGF